MVLKVIHELPRPMGVHMLELDSSGHRVPSEVEKGVEICSFFPPFMPQLHAFFNDLRVVPGTYYVL
jgi:hypothetical protein